MWIKLFELVFFPPFMHTYQKVFLLSICARHLNKLRP